MKTSAVALGAERRPFGERRRFIRHPICLPLSYTRIGRKTPGPDALLEQTTVDVSMGGILFRSDRPAPPTSSILIRMPFHDRLFNVRAKVVHCEPDAESGRFRIGVSFYRMGDALRVKLLEEIYQITLFRDLLSVQRGEDVSVEDASLEWIRRYSKGFRRRYG